MMQLRTRLLVGYAYLVVLLLVAAGSAALIFLDLSQGIGRVLEENFRSVRAAVDMLQALERQDSLTLTLLVDPATAGDDFETLDAAFTEALGKAEANVTLSGERESVTRIRNGFARLQAARRRLFARSPDSPLAAYRAGVEPVFTALRTEVVRLLEMNHEAMLAADAGARRTASRAGVWLGGLAALALLSLPLVSRAMQRGVIDRLRGLRDAVRAIAQGDARRRLHERGTDELAVVAAEFNRLLDERDELRGRLDGRLAHQRQLLLGLVAELGDGAAVLGLDGALVAWAGREPASADLERLREWAGGAGREHAGTFGSAELELTGGRRVRLDLLAAGGERPVGWLVRPVAGQSPGEAPG